ncbi:MAG: hypothetical protein IPO64_15185 [Bacteroidetes bacterium]|nr:hypothetical protein [Bacteroidota bacterium]
MVQFIKNVILQFGGRYFGSEQEKKAQIYTKGVLEQYCDKTEIIPFESALEAHFQSLKIFCIVYVLSLITFKFNIVFGAFLSVSNTVLFLGHFVTYRHWLDFLFKKKTSYNVIGDIEPIQTATSTIIISGHIDSVKEFKWWYRLKHAGAVLSVIAVFISITFSFYGISNICPSTIYRLYMDIFFIVYAYFDCLF